MTRLSVRRADRIITPTRFGREQVLDYFGLPEEKVKVIHHGFNEHFLEPCEPEEIDRVKQVHGITGDYVLTVGDLHPRKNLPRLTSRIAVRLSDRLLSYVLISRVLNAVYIPLNFLFRKLQLLKIKAKVVKCKISRRSEI